MAYYDDMAQLSGVWFPDEVVSGNVVGADRALSQAGYTSVVATRLFLKYKDNWTAVKNGMTEAMWQSYHTSYPTKTKEEWVDARCNTLSSSIGIMPQVIKTLYNGGVFDWEIYTDVNDLTPVVALTKQAFNLSDSQIKRYRNLYDTIMRLISASKHEYTVNGVPKWDAYAQSESVESVRLYLKYVESYPTIMNGTTDEMFNTYNANHPEAQLTKSEWLARRYNTLAGQLHITAQVVESLYTRGITENYYSNPVVNNNVRSTAKYWARTAFNIDASVLEGYITLHDTIIAINNGTNSTSYVDSNNVPKWNDLASNTTINTDKAVVKSMYLIGLSGAGLMDFGTEIATYAKQWSNNTLSSTSAATLNQQREDAISDFTGKTSEYRIKAIGKQVATMLNNAGVKKSNGATYDATYGTDYYNDVNVEETAMTNSIVSDVNTKLTALRSFRSIATELVKPVEYLVGLIFHDDIVGDNGIFTVRNDTDKFWYADYVTITVPSGSNITTVPIYQDEYSTTVRVQKPVGTTLLYNRLSKYGRYSIKYKANESDAQYTQSGWISTAYGTVTDNVRKAYQQRIIKSRLRHTAVTILNGTTDQMFNDYNTNHPDAQLTKSEWLARRYTSLATQLSLTAEVVELIYTSVNGQTITDSNDTMLASDLVDYKDANDIQYSGVISICRNIHQGLWLKAKIEYYDRNTTINPSTNDHYTDWAIAEALGILNDQDAVTATTPTAAMTKAGNFVNTFRQYTF